MMKVENKEEIDEFRHGKNIVVNDKKGGIHVLTADDATIDAQTKVEIVKGIFSKELTELRKERSMAKEDIGKNVKFVRENLIKDGRLDANNNAVTKNTELTTWAKQHKNIVAVADGSGVNVYKRNYDDMGTEVYLERAEDDRVIGIPHTMVTAGDKIYIINGRVMTGWSMYFSLTAIKSPEDYGKNVDLAYNVPYLYSSLLLKSQLGLGVGYNINYGSDDEEIPEEKFIKDLHLKKLKIKRSMRMKTAFHKYVYGNAYWHIKRDKDDLPIKITVLQPERIKIFLDPMTTKILFYIYLPPIIGGTVLTPYPESNTQNPNLMHNMALTYPIPIIIRPEDIIHFKQNAFTEYPFGFSDIRACIDPAQARLDINLLAPIIFKKYAKPMIHWSLKIRAEEGLPVLSNKQITTKINDMVDNLQNLEPGSDPVTTERWSSQTLVTPTGQNELLVLTQDLDTQVFAVNGVPETYFKPKGSTDRMISEQDKTFMGRLEGDREDFVDLIEEPLIQQPIDIMIEKKRILPINDDVDGGKIMDEMDKWLMNAGSFMAEQPRYPELEWKEAMKQDETQELANTIAMLNNGIINTERAAKRLGEAPPEDGTENELNNLMNNGGTNGGIQDFNLNSGFKTGVGSTKPRMNIPEGGGK